MASVFIIVLRGGKCETRRCNDPVISRDFRFQISDFRFAMLDLRFGSGWVQSAI
jgi:hypothetical protein